jgi:hypothetical protein
MARKLKRKQTENCEQRIKSLEDRLGGTVDRLDAAVERLDAAVAESKRLGKALDDLQKRDPLSDLRQTLRKRFAAAPQDELRAYDPDETVN